MSGPAPAPRPIRVMHVVHILALAGMEYGVIKLVNRLDRARFEPSIACLLNRHPSSDTLLDPRIPVFELHRSDGRDYRLILRLARLFREQRIDVVHSHNWQTFLYAVLAARRAGVPVIVHGEHGREAEPPALRQILIKRHLARFVKRIHTVSADIAAEIVERWKVPPQRVVHIPNGVDLNRFADAVDTGPTRAALGIGSDDPLVLSIGGLRPVKDYPTLIRAFAALAGEFPAARLVIAGGVDSVEPRERLAALAGELGVGSRVHLAGLRRDVPELLAASSVYVNSSLFEGMSNTLLEAMAAGKPVVATAVGGNPEIVRDGETGYLVPAGDPIAMAERIAVLLRDAALADRVGRSARSHVQRHYAMSGMVERYQEFYQETFLREMLRPGGSVKERTRRIVSKAVVRSGLGRIRSRIDRGRLAVLTYHRVLPLRDFLDYPFTSMALPKDHFEAQIAHLARRYEVLPMAEALARLRAGTLPSRAIAITFDDGYADNYIHALPVLRRHAIPATLFVVSGAVFDRTTLWWDEVAERVAQIAERGLAGDVLPPGIDRRVFDQLTSTSRGRTSAAAARNVVRRMNQMTRDERSRTLLTLREMADQPEAVPGGLMMTPDELRETQESGIEIGAHTVTHAFMDECDDDTALLEIRTCVETLNEALGVRARYFAYPRGRASEAARRIVAKAGIEAAFTTAVHLNDPSSDPMALGRIDAGHAQLRGDFDPAVFDVEVQRWFAGFRAAVGR